MPCADCGRDTIGVEYYMVHDHVWAAAGMADDADSEFLCTGCLERRLGRPLSGGDFPAAPAHQLARHVVAGRLAAVARVETGRGRARWRAMSYKERDRVYA
jgi:hypothetical protein